MLPCSAGLGEGHVCGQGSPCTGVGEQGRSLYSNSQVEQVLTCVASLGRGESLYVQVECVMANGHMRPSCKYQVEAWKIKLIVGNLITVSHLITVSVWFCFF